MGAIFKIFVGGLKFFKSVHYYSRNGVIHRITYLSQKYGDYLGKMLPPLPVQIISNNFMSIKLISLYAIL